MPNLGPGVRGGKNAFWMPANSNGETNWHERLLNALSAIIQEFLPA
jgi:hypothetical protein